jgi:hypothetical protein
MPKLQALVIFVCAFGPRAILSALEPAKSGDWTVYETVALNILNNGCVSLSDPGAGTCVPHWGGNHLPGFPAFVALVWKFTDRVWLPVALAHSAVFAISASYLFVALRRALPSPGTAFLCALIVALSPLTLPWARFTLSETLALSVVVCITADLCRSVAERKLRIFPLAAMMAVGLFIRYDLALLALPIAFIGFIVHPFRSAIQRGVLMIVIISIPLGAWWARSVASGLGATPPLYFLGNGYAAPKGYLEWAETWATNQYQAPEWWYPIHFAAYSDIIIDESAYTSIDERNKIKELLVRLEDFDGKQFPMEIDLEFARIAAAKRAATPLNHWLWLPVLRIGRIWINPYNSGGWPVALGWTGGTLSFETAFEFLRQNPGSILVKGATAAYRIGILIVATVLLLLTFRQRATFASIILWAAMLHTVGRTVFLGWGFFIESRYLLEVIPMLEVAVVMTIAEFSGRNAPTGIIARIRGDAWGETS